MGRLRSSGLFTIGKLARRGGVTVSTIRHYERSGLLAAVRRTPGNFRLYDDDSVAVLRFVRRAKALGLTLRDMEAVLRCAALPGPPRFGEGRRRALRKLTGRIESIHSQMDRLQRVHRVLRKSAAVVGAGGCDFRRILSLVAPGQGS